MTLTDMLHESYIKIYDSIRIYDYSIGHYTDLLHCMCSLQTVIYSLNNLEPNEKISKKQDEEIEELCRKDFCRAYKGFDYC
jgi:hypothetical protein